MVALSYAGFTVAESLYFQLGIGFCFQLFRVKWRCGHPSEMIQDCGLCNSPHSLASELFIYSNWPSVSCTSVMHWLVVWAHVFPGQVSWKTTKSGQCLWFVLDRVIVVFYLVKFAACFFVFYFSTFLQCTFCNNFYFHLALYYQRLTPVYFLKAQYSNLCWKYH